MTLAAPEPIVKSEKETIPLFSSENLPKPESSFSTRAPTQYKEEFLGKRDPKSNPGVEKPNSSLPKIEERGVNLLDRQMMKMKTLNSKSVAVPRHFESPNGKQSIEKPPSLSSLSSLD